MTSIKITGQPVCEFEFIGLPSVNTHYNLHFRARHIPTAEWRYEAREKAMDWIEASGHSIWLDTPIIKRAFVLVRVYPPYEEISDIHNVHIKPLLDGFSDAGLWADDEWAFVPFTAFMFAGIGQHKPREKKLRRSVVAIYELDSVSVGGDLQQLPKGRRKL